MSTANQPAASTEATSSTVISTLHRMTNSITLRAVTTVLLTLTMLIPMGMVSSIVAERSYRYQGVLQEIASVWGQEQTLSGPILSIPFTERVVITETVNDQQGVPRDRKKTIDKQRTAYFLPRDLQVTTTLDEEFRSRSIFRSLVYRSSIKLTAEYATPDILSMADNILEIHWHKATISLGVSDTRAINSVDLFEWNGHPGSLSPGTQIAALHSGFHAKLGDTHGLRPPSAGTSNPTALPPTTTLKKHQLQLRLSINGSGGFYFTPHGERSRMSIQSSWPHPSFQGAILPVERTINADGFNATWDIPHLARNYAQQWVDSHETPNLFEITAGVRMFEPDSLYSRITRASKYGILFIGLTFLTLFIFEISIGQRIHLLQYGLIGISLSLFYLTLLSLSEHISFIKSYAIATLISITMISVYCGYVLKNISRGLIIAVLLFGLYSLLYSLIQLEDYALFMGTVVLLAVVIVLMVVTRHLGPSASQ